MTILRDVLAELFRMFVADARLTGAVLAVVVVAALLARATALPGLIAGVVLLCGSVAVLAFSVRRAAAARKSKRT